MSLARFADEIRNNDFAPRFGLVRSVSPGLVEASGPVGTIGELCTIECAGGDSELAEIVALDERRVLLTPMNSTRAIPLGARVTALAGGDTVPVGDGFAGRAVDALGAPIDGGPRPKAEARAKLLGDVPAPLEREASDAIVATGIKAIDALLTMGRGQRVGVVAASGAGKTSLMEQLAFQAEVDHVVCCLVGERGREVETLWSHIQSRDDAERFTIIAATSDESAAHRARAPSFALALAEHWRAAGRTVLLVVDSVTRLAMALREIGLAAGSPPTVRAYTPNVFSALPRLVERCGALRTGGSITAVMTVLSETDDVDDPIVELMKSLLDGHIVLSRTLAEQGQFPAIDVTRSVSRGVERRVSDAHREALREAISLLSVYAENRVMIETGAYRTGTNALLDRAIVRQSSILNFLRQPMDAAASFEDALSGLRQAVGQMSHAV